MTWRPNTGVAPVFYPQSPDQPCPAHLIPASEAAGARVRVRLRCGTEASCSWPVMGKPLPTRWTLIGHDFDILEWRRT